MVDLVTNNYSLVQPTVGGDLNLWGGVLNNGVIAALDATLGSNLSVAITTTDVTLTTAQFQSAIFVVTGALTGNRNLILPLSPNSATVAVGGRFIVVNNTTGSFTLTVITAASGSTGVTVPQGFSANLYSNGTNVGSGTTGGPAFAQAVNGNPDGQLAGTAGSINTNASLAFDYTNNTFYICTTTGTTSTAVWTNPVSGSLPQPALQGYLTPISNTPIITGDSIGATVIYYTPFVGTWAAIHNGTLIVPYRFSQMQLTLSTSQAASNIYDVFLAYNSGTPVIGTGPSWLAGSGGSITAGSCARGTGTGGTAINRDATTGLWVNTVSMSLIYNTGSGNNTITVAAGQGIYLGSIYMDATPGQVTCHRSYGQSRKWGIWNYFNRVPIYLKAGDSTPSWTYSTSTWRAANGSTANSLTTFSGVAEDIFDFSYDTAFSNNSSGLVPEVAIGYNATNSPSGKIAYTNNASVSTQLSTPTAKYEVAPALGINVVTALEGVFGSLGGTQTWYGTETNMLLRAQWRV